MLANVGNNLINFLNFDKISKNSNLVLPTYSKSKLYWLQYNYIKKVRHNGVFDSYMVIFGLSGITKKMFGILNQFSKIRI